MSTKNLGKQIRAARLAAKLSRQDLGSSVGRGYQTVYRWESGETRPSDDDLAKIAEACGVPLLRFLKALTSVAA